MRAWPRRGGRVAAGICGALVGAGAVVTLQGEPFPPGGGPARRLVTVPKAEVARGVDLSEAGGRHGTTLLAWAPGGLPAGSERIAEATPGVIDATTVLAGLEWMKGSRAPDGTAVDDPPRGYSIPLELAVIEPKEYATFVRASERAGIADLERGEAVLAGTEASLRGAGEGLLVDLGSRSVRVTSVVSDDATNGYEALVSGEAPPRWTSTNRFVLMHVASPSARRKVERKLEATLEPGRLLRIRAEGEAPFLRYGDAVMPQMLIKANFGEFSARPVADGRIDIEESWVKANIQAVTLPALEGVGKVRCHRAMIPQLRAALDEVASGGLAYTIDDADYGGCFAPRFIGRDPGGRLSHHSWGVAIDINARANAFGTKPDQDGALVKALVAHGLAWGGDWLVPDGMHFEWVEFP